MDGDGTLNDIFEKEKVFDDLVALKELGGSGNNDEILSRVIANLKLPDEVVDIPHLSALNISELQYRLAWLRTYLKLYGAIDNSARCVWFSVDSAAVRTLPPESGLFFAYSLIERIDLS